MYSLKSPTVNALRPSADAEQGAVVRDDYTEDDITLDPLIVLRCDSRVFRFVINRINYILIIIIIIIISPGVLASEG